MALTLSVELQDATLEDISALVKAARSAGAAADARVTLEESTLKITVEDPRGLPKREPQGLDAWEGRRKNPGPGSDSPSPRHSRPGRSPGAEAQPTGTSGNPLEFLDNQAARRGVDELVDAGSEAIRGIFDFISEHLERNREPGSGRGPAGRRGHSFGSFRDADEDGTRDADEK